MSNTCTIEGCEKPRFGHGWCNAHYSRWRKHGDPLGGAVKAGPQRQHEVCTIEGCGKKHYAYGLCSAHYHRKRRHGDPLNGGTSPGAPLEFLKVNVSHEGDSCLMWPFAKFSDGYGAVTFRGKQTTANFVMCVFAHGEPPTPVHESAHSCGLGHTSCVHPGHLRWATRSENHADKVPHDTHNRGERHPHVILTEEQAAEIKGLRRKVRQKPLAQKYNVTVSTISAIQRGKNWAWLNG